MADIISSSFQKGELFSAKKTSLHILKVTPPSHRDTPGPNSPFLPSWINKWCRVFLARNWRWGKSSGYQVSGKYCKAWKRYASIWNIDPFLQGCDQIDIVIVVTASSEWVRKGNYISGVQINVPNISKALSAITTSIHLVGNTVPKKT